MNPHTIILTTMIGFGAAGVAWGLYEGVKAISGTIEGIKEENREYQRELAKP